MYWFDRFTSFMFLFLYNVFGANFLPSIINYNNVSWFETVVYDGENWEICYFRYVEKAKKELLFRVLTKKRYIAYMAMLRILWKNRKHLNFSLEI